MNKSEIPDYFEPEYGESCCNNTHRYIEIGPNLKSILEKLLFKLEKLDNFSVAPVCNLFSKIISQGENHES